GPLMLAGIGLTKYFPAARGVGLIRALDGVSVRVAEGETLGIVGESGSGKTTLARLFLLLERPTAGALLFDGKPIDTFSPDDLRRFRRTVQAVFQDPFSSLNPRMRVGDIVAEPLPPEPGLGRAAVRQIVETGECDAVYTEPLHPYTQALLSAALPLHPAARRPRVILPGEVPNPMSPPPGCRFHPRCPRVMEQCGSRAPAFKEAKPDRL